MRRQTTPPVAFLVALAVTASACGSPGDEKPVRALEAGPYDITISKVLTDSCWPSISFPPPDLVLSFLVEAEEGGSFIASPQAATAYLLPTLTGSASGEKISASGSAVFDPSAECAIAVTVRVTGKLGAGGSFEAMFETELTSALAGSECSALSGQSIGTGLIPVPDALASNGTCSLSFSATAAPAL